MSKVAVLYWSGTGNTEMMAKAVAEGAKEKGADVTLKEIDTFDAGDTASFDALAFGCPAMGDEQLEEDVFEPAFNDCKPGINGKNIALFGSYGWGDCDWMRSWEDDCKEAGAVLVTDSVTCNEEPDADGLAACKALGAALA